MPKITRWVYGVTTVPSRRLDYLPKTLASLKEAGFDKPRLFIDRAMVITAESYRQEFGLEVTCRDPEIRTYGNWILGLAELYIREPMAHRYAMFQDDMVCCRNLRSYLNQYPYPEKGYWNLYTFPINQDACPQDYKGFYHAEVKWKGKGALALVFNREAVQTLFSSLHIIRKPTDPVRGWRTVDGAVVQALGDAGWKEYVHNPSLVQHVGTISSMNNHPHPQAPSFRGEDFDALELLKEVTINRAIQL